MWNLVISLMFVAVSPNADCACLCVDTSPVTVCQTAESAHFGPDVCVGLLRCDVPTVDEFIPELLDAPREDVGNCRTARVWLHEFSEHRIKRICDTMR